MKPDANTGNEEINKIIEAFKTLYALIPNWEHSEHRRFTVLLSRETWLEYNPATKILKIKVRPCLNCGLCCMDFLVDQSIHGCDEGGKCNALYLNGERWLCGANFDTPYRCLVAAKRSLCPYYDEIIKEVKIG